MNDANRTVPQFVGAAPSVLRKPGADSSPAAATLPVAPAVAAAFLHDDAPVYRTCDNCGVTYRRELTSHFADSSAGETTQCWACLGYDGIDEQVLECVEVVDHPGEMGPFYCPAGCAATDRDDHEEGCEWRCAAPGCREELGSTRERQCGVCIDHDDDAPGYTSRGDAHLMAVTAPGAR